MTEMFISLMIIAGISAFTPIVARIIPKQIVPETVLLIVAGAILGPNMFDLIKADSNAITVLSELGCAFLFLLAGYEINPRVLTAKDGKKGLATWAVSLLIAFILTSFLPQLASGTQGKIATALLFTTTALGALMPILKEEGIMDTVIGDKVIAYGTWGELATVLAMAVLLSTRATWATGLILGLLVIICLWISFIANKAVEHDTRLYNFIEAKAKTTSQSMVRLTILLLILLVAFSAVFELDIVLGAFAAGFVLRYISPADNKDLEEKLDGIAYGFLVPLFFIVSGAHIDLAAVLKYPILLVVFILGLVLIRAIPIVVSLSLEKDKEDRLDIHNRFSVAFYCTTALPLIVAITGIAQRAGLMQADIASVLVAAGALTVFVMPLLGKLTYSLVDADPVNAVVEIFHSPREMMMIIHKHIELERSRAREYREMARETIQSRIDQIQDPQEKAAMLALVKRQQAENQAFTKEQIKEGQDLWNKHKQEIIDLYHQFHQDQDPDQEIFEYFEDSRK
ncbi:cation:proton antiporter [Eremococcus coleocola]|uniref:Transporter, CPA2 family n=1 Tax=Eremococcus coleocola ACS-139-V-Col8 TaxID=908337 RepID=E4KNS8_9LACT|nr:cation:proton antiporter [Eremococcus coleocola]EFR31311.1 transporter, CPA2 family [Eremococcus coleocola ACS-139-V-Col8]